MQGHRMDQNVNLKIFYTSTRGILVSTYKEKALKYRNLRNQFKLQDFKLGLGHQKWDRDDGVICIWR